MASETDSQSGGKPKSEPEITSQPKKVPETRALRDQIRQAAKSYVQSIDPSTPLTREIGQQMAEQLLGQSEQSESYLGFTLVSIANAFWRHQLAAIPFHRRLLCLTRCPQGAIGSAAADDAFGSTCGTCGACSLAAFKERAEELGYKVLEDTSTSLHLIKFKYVDAFVMIASLDDLEKALDQVLLAGIPCIAIPLFSRNDKNALVDTDCIVETIELSHARPETTLCSYVYLMQASNRIFAEPDLSRLIPRQHTGGTGNEPLAQHEAIAHDFLARGGKRSRPFITLATYDALTGGRGRISADDLEVSDSVLRTALAIEAFHKASLVHDDIEDDDIYRYGQETLHRKHGISTAINVGDYLVGLGYRLVSRERKTLGGDRTADILDRLAEAHLKLAEGQGAELLWREAEDQTLTPRDALTIYALKTAPAFEAALYAGVRLAVEAEPYEQMISHFSRHLGVGFQILNDLKDWQGDGDNKLVAGQDVLAARPTLLLALALDAGTSDVREELLDILQVARSQDTVRDTLRDQQLVMRVRILFDRLQIFTKADKLIENYRARAEAIADDAQPDEFRELLYYLVDTVLDRRNLPDPTLFMVELDVPR